MVDILSFIVVTVVSMIDPIAIVAYALAAFLPKTWRGVIIGGVIAGFAVATLTYVMQSQYQTPKMFLIVGQFAGCVLGAIILRWIINMVRAARANKTTT
jgi:hypothetical protein